MTVGIKYKLETNVRVLIACESSGIVRDAFIKLGHDAMSCDLLETESPGPHYKGDIRDILDVHHGYVPKFDLMIAHPTCTRLCNSGVRWLHKPPKSKTLDQIWQEFKIGVDFYKLFQNANSIPLRAIENPIMHRYAIEKIKPIKRQIVQPWWFGDEAFKATGFELIGLPELIPTNKLLPPKPGSEDHKKWSAIHRASPSPDRWKQRSKTFQGMADAMALQWGSVKC